MKLFYCDQFVLPLPEKHRFPMQKYSRLRERLAQSPDFAQAEFLIPQPASDEQLLLAHDADYLARAKDGELTAAQVRALGFPWSAALVERSRRSVGGTIAAARSALSEGVGANLAGGTHHAFRDRGEGFCVFNDAVVAVRTLQAEGLIEKAVILDCDVHQGNGTACIVADDPTIFSFSIHGKSNYPIKKEVSDLDIALPDGTDDETYLHLLTPAVQEVLELSSPDLAIYLGGADPYVEDRFGRLGLSKAGLARRDEIVFSLCREANVPVAVVMAGGYAKNIDDIVDIHYQTMLLAKQMLAR